MLTEFGESGRESGRKFVRDVFLGQEYIFSSYSNDF
jgi:hypothetical protein